MLRALLMGMVFLLVSGCPLPLADPFIASFSPPSGYQGTLVTINGLNFSPVRTDNQVKIGNVEAVVVSATPTQIEALVGFGASDGPVEVTVAGTTTTSVNDFAILDWPAAGSGEDGPPIFFEGAGTGATGDLSSTGTVDVLVVVSYPTDRVPPNLATERQNIADKWDMVHTFYDQASYGALDVQVTVTDWVALSGTFDDYYSAAHANLDPAVLDRFTAECADGAESQGFDLDDFDAMSCFIWTNGVFLRAWGGWSKSNFSYADDDAGIDINITVGHEVHLTALGETANWGRCAHELGHNLVHAGAVLGEDVYRSDLVDPDAATAASFDMMGSHDNHPLFSGAYLHQLGWFDGANIVELEWDRNPFSHDYELAAHRTTEQDTGDDVYHLVRIRVAEGLYYFVEVRQKPPPGDPQVFDTDIPVDGAPNDGGVIVTKVITDEVNNNQQMRFITLLHEPRVLTVGDVAVDPLRALEISVIDEQMVGSRLHSTVRIEWAQEMEPDPSGDFDLRIEPWGPGYETVDIWIDRQPWGVFDHTDGAGNPVGNGDRPQPLAINHFWGRVHCDGSADANDVQLTFYAITPPGVGDNGTWTPLETVTIPTVTAGDAEEEFINWVPTVGEHTCLQLVAGEQLGEISFGNNKAQENVFEFEAPADSPPDPVRIPLAVRNPLDEPRVILLRMIGVPEGYMVQLPHHWVYLPPLGETELEAIVIATHNVTEYQRERPALNLVIDGFVTRQYSEKVDDTDPGSRMAPIGGFVARVTPKHRGTVELREDQERSTAKVIALQGTVTPGFDDQAVQVVLTDPLGRLRVANVLTTTGGNFRASFDLSFAPTEDPIAGTPGPAEEPVSGEYRAQAFIVNADDIAQAESNVVTLKR